MSELTRAELLSGHYRDKYGRLRNEKGKFVYESVDYESDEPLEDVKEWYDNIERKREIVKLNSYVYVCRDKIEPILSDKQIEVLCFVGVIVSSGLLWKVVQCLLSLFV